MAPIPVMATVNPTASADNKTLPPTLKGLVVFLWRREGKKKPPVQLGVNKKLTVQKKTSCAKIEVVWRPHD